LSGEHARCFGSGGKIGNFGKWEEVEVEDEDEVQAEVQTKVEVKVQGGGTRAATACCRALRRNSGCLNLILNLGLDPAPLSASILPGPGHST